MMEALTQHIQQVVRRDQLFRTGECVVAAVSGGADSVGLLVLLDAIAQDTGFELVVAHLDHGLGTEAATEAASRVTELGGRLGWPTEVGIIDLDPEAPNWEEAARRARYAFLAAVAARHGARSLAVGHTANDQAETLLLRLIRGSGPRGLAAMATISPMPATLAGTEHDVSKGDSRGAGLRLVRPLLGVARADLQAYLKSKQIVTVNDRTNQELSRARNRVRHQLLPLLQERFNPRIVETLCRTADLMEDTDRFMESAAEVILSSEVLVTADGAPEGTALLPWQSAPRGSKVRLELPRLATYDGIQQRYILRAALRRLRGDLRGVAFQHIDAVLKLANGKGQAAHLPGGMVATRERGVLCIWLEEPEEAPEIAPVQIAIPGSATLDRQALEVTAALVQAPEARLHENRDPMVAFFDPGDLAGPLTLRSRRPGDRMQPLGLAGSKKVKDLLIDAGIPRRLRGSVPILEDAGRILWIVGVRRSAHALVTGDADRVVEVKLSSLNSKQANPSS